MKHSKSTIVLKSGKTKSPVSAPDKERLATLKQKIKDAKLHLQGIKRALSEAKDAIKRAKQEFKNARKSALKSTAKQMGKKQVKAKIVKQDQVKSIALSGQPASKSAGIKKPATRKPAVSKVVTTGKPLRTRSVQAKQKFVVQPAQLVSTPVVRKRSPRLAAPAVTDTGVATPVTSNPESVKT